MIFTTFQFLAFFAVVFPLYFGLPKSWRHPVLLAASYYFYMCSVPWYLTVIVAITLIDFVAGIRIEEASSPRSRRTYLIVSLVSNLGILGAFKYAGFFTANINDVFGLNLPVLRLILPLGISFHTFQAIAYTVEVYRGRCPAERSLLRYSLYVAFFPQMVAGPIERPFNLLPQLHATQQLRAENFTSGLRLAMWGLFKKVVVADTLAQPVNVVYGYPQQFSGQVLILGTFFFSIQIYCDFSGYSDIARGIARMMGFNLMVNFRQPYFARSIGEFWHRWHISLSTWFRDYLYLPLGGSRVSSLEHAANLLVVFLVSGFWHGANWTFVIWGGLHGLYLVGAVLTAPLRERIRTKVGVDPSGRLLAVLQVLATFTFVTVAWVFFRAANVRDGMFIVSHMLDWHGFHIIDLFALGLPRFELAIAFLTIAIVGVTEWIIVHQPPTVARLWAKRPYRWGCYYACAFGIVFFGVFERVQFIYFQF